MTLQKPITIVCVSTSFRGNPFIETCKKEGCTTILLTVEKTLDKPWCREYLDEVFALPNFDDWTAVKKALNDLARTHEIDRLCGFDDYDIDLVAHLREHIRVPGMEETAARYFRDKLAMRSRAARTGIPIPAFVHILNDERIRRFLRDVPPPWMLKPRHAASSRGIMKCTRPDQVWERIERLGDQHSDFLLEQMIAGDVYHVDSIVSEGTVVFAEAHRYWRPLFELSQKGGVFATRTAARDDPATHKLLALNQELLRKFEFVRGAAHSEYIRSAADGEFYFLETAARVGGGDIGKLVEASTRVNLWSEWARIEIAQGEWPYELPQPIRRDYGGLIVSRAIQEVPDTSHYDDPEICWRVDRKNQVGFALHSPSHERIDELIESYLSRIKQDFIPPAMGGKTIAEVLPNLMDMSREEHEEFFRKLLWDVDEPTAPFGLLDVQGDGRGIGEARAQLDAGLAQRLREVTRKLGVSVAALCHVAWAQVLARTTGRDDVVFGTVLYGRAQGGEGVGRMPGMFFNTLPVRIRIGEESVEASVRRTHTQLADLMRHEHAPLALAQRCSGVPAPTPLFSALFKHRRSSGMTQAAPDGEERTNYPLTFSVDDAGSGFSLRAQVEAPIEPIRVCDLMRTALERLVEALATAPATAVRSVDVLPESERRRVVEEWNATETEYASQQCIHELFEAQVRKSPNAVAVVCDERELSYGELNVRANQLAHYLRELGLKPDGRVAICLEERGFEMIVGMLAVWKAGGAFVPLTSLTYRSRWIRRIRASGMAVVLTQGTLAGLFTGVSAGLPVLDLTAELPPWANQPETNLDRTLVGVRPEHLAYLIYTSGSTGIPKAVMVEHRGLCNLVAAEQVFAVEPDSRVLQFASFSFDACVFEVLMALCRGAALYIPPQEGMPLGEALTWTVERHGITHATVSPAVLATLDEEVDLASVRTMVVAGDILPEAVAKRWARGRRLINAYGPTEATVWATMHDCQTNETGRPPVGRPIANVKIYILDAHMQPVPIAVTGEIYIGGAGVARGYLQKPELTAERFIRDPFSSEPGARMYKTGDLGKWLPDGNIEFLGRNDFQVKVRGFRIEMGDIEARLVEHPGVREAAVLAREDSPGDKRLVAYYTAAVSSVEGEAVGSDALRTFLSESLAEYMVPETYVRLERFHLTPSGKLDRKALPAP